MGAGLSKKLTESNSGPDLWTVTIFTSLLSSMELHQLSTVEDAASVSGYDFFALSIMKYNGDDPIVPRILKM